MLNPGQPMHYFSEEVGIVNGTYVGNTSAFCAKLGLHEFKDMAGALCMGKIQHMEAGHHKSGKRRWR